MNKKLCGLIILVLFMVLLAGCMNNVDVLNKKVDKKQEEVQKPLVDISDKYSSNIKPNELGQVMILMYHGIGSKEDEWTRTPENFRKDLETLYKKGYRLIGLKDLIDNNINIPAGYTPVVITFDDGRRGQFNLIEKDGKLEVDRNSAVGILEDFYKEHSDFGLKATFFIYYPVPFEQKEYIEYKLKYLVDKGFEIGNHTYNHDSLNKMDAQGIQKTLALNVFNTQKYLKDYSVDILALPYGIMPQKNLRNLVIDGEWNGIRYHNRAILLVGANPSYSPYDKRFNPYRLPRIRASEIKTSNLGLYDWLKFFDKHPEMRYISDGDPNTITIPENLKDRVISLNDKRLKVYTVSNSSK